MPINSSILPPHRDQAELARRLRRLAAWIRGLLLVGAPVIAAVPVCLLLAPEPLLALGWGSAGPCSQDAIPLLLKSGVTPAMGLRLSVLSLLPVGLWLLTMWQLWSLFGEYGLGRVFSPRALLALRRLGTCLLAMFAMQPLFTTLMSLALSWDRPRGHREISLSLGSDDYMLLLLALLLLALARVMQEAARVAEENDGFV
jgi:hypothetical protein